MEKLWTAENMNKLKNLSANAEELGIQRTFPKYPKQVCVTK
jgi:hypothetical protein